jgi:sugar-specific transcriptional regulator TrmB
MEYAPEETCNIVKMYNESSQTYKFIKHAEAPTKSMEEIETMLHRLGLSKNEIRVYLRLAHVHESKASEISESLNLHRTETYKILRDLEKRGLVSSVFEKPIKFIATPFESAIDALIEAKKLRIQKLERRKKDLVDLWHSLPQPDHEEERKEVFQMLEGEDQIDLKSNEIIQNTKREILFFVAEEDLPRFYHSGVTDKLRALARMNIAVKFLTTDSARSRYFVEKIKLLNAMNLPPHVKEVPTFILSDQDQLLLIIKKTGEKGKKAVPKKAGLWTNCVSFTRALEALFVELWSAHVPLVAIEQ